MNYANNLLRLPKLRLLIAGLFGIFAILLLQGTAHAAGVPIPSNTLPESSDFSQGNNVWLTVANADGSNFLLNAHTSVVRIYSANPTINLTITNGGHCPGNGPDQGAGEGEATTRFEFRRLGYSPNYDYRSAPYNDAGSAAPDRYSNQLGCGSSTILLQNDPNNNVPASATGYAQNGKYAFEIRAEWQNLGAYGWNQFKMQVGLGQGRLSYYAGSGDHFALKANDSCAYPGCTGDFSMGFAPNCKLDDGDTRNVTINWFDADAGQPNQGGQSPVKTAIIEYDANNNQNGFANIVSANGATDAGAGQLYITSGNNVGGSATITIRGHHKYAWIWYNIHTANGIQFQLPTDSYNTLINFRSGGDCTPPSTKLASCTITPSNATPANNIAITIKPTVTNASSAGGPNFDTSYQLRQISFNGSPAGGTRNLTQPLSPGQTDNNMTSFTPAARSNAAVDFYFNLFDGAGNLVQGNSNPLCHTRVTWGNAPPSGSGEFTVDCRNVTLSNFSSSATYYKAPPYRTNTPPSISPNIWGVPPPYNPNGSFIYQGPSNSPPIPATVIPIDIKFLDSGGGLVAEKTDRLNNPTAQRLYDTFNDFQALWPHLAYRATLDAQTSGSLGQDQNGQPVYNLHLESNALDGGCLQADISTVCVGPSSVDVEPGQRAQASYTVQFINNTNRPFPASNPGGYNFHVSTSGGIVYLGSDPAQASDIAAGTSPPVTIQIPIRAETEGSFWVTFRFQGSTLSLNNWSGDCSNNPGNPSVATHPYFEVRGSDISTGGGFSAPFGSCQTTYPGYVSPLTTPISQKELAGGIRSYARIVNDSGAPRGSSSEYGTLSLGLTIGTLDGPLGFFSRHGEMFANDIPSSINGINNLGGYLNPTTISQAHCVNDFYTQTKLTGTAPSAFTGNTINGLANAQYQATGPLTLHASNIAVGQQVTLYVDGDVTIDGNITYAKSWDPTDQTKVPYFALIVRGNITLTSGVTQLDGLYVAQPSTANNGIFSTCNDFCPTQLIVNGAVIAQQVSLTRVHGTVGPSETDINGLCTPFPPSNCPPAEIFNYVPSMVIGSPQFNPNPATIEALFSLPPVF